MYMRRDWLMRQIQILTAAIAQLLFQNSGITYEIKDMEHLNQTDLLYSRLRDLVGRGRVCEAEDLLFDALETEQREHLALAVDFYQALNALSDEELEAADFPRAEIDSGLHEVLELFGVYLPGF